MRTVLLGPALTVAILCLPNASTACGDKLVVLGLGVRFERLGRAKHPGSILLYMSPRSALAQADREFRFSAALELAGHSVESVASLSELEDALGARQNAVVLADLSDALALRDQAPDMAFDILPILYKPSTEQLAEAQKVNPCLAQAARRKNGQLLEIVDQMMAQHKNGQRATCASPKRKGT